MHRDFKGIWVPREIWLFEDLSIQEKCLWAEIHSLYDRDRGGCYASEEYLCEFIGVKRSRLYEMLKRLKDLGLIETVSFDGRNTLRRAIVPKDSAEESWTAAVRKTGHQESGKPDTRNPENRTGSTTSPYIHSSKEENKDKNIAQTAAPLRPSAPDISFSFANNKFENVSDEDLNTWSQLYPTVDVKREMTEMVEWIKENPSKAKSKKQWRKFIRGWLQRQNEKLTNRSAYQSTKDKQVISRHTGFQKDNRPRNPNRTLDLREEQ